MYSWSGTLFYLVRSTLVGDLHHLQFWGTCKRPVQTWSSWEFVYKFLNTRSLLPMNWFFSPPSSSTPPPPWVNYMFSMYLTQWRIDYVIVWKERKTLITTFCIKNSCQSSKLWNLKWQSFSRHRNGSFKWANPDALSPQLKILCGVGIATNMATINFNPCQIPNRKLARATFLSFFLNREPNVADCFILCYFCPTIGIQCVGRKYSSRLGKDPGAVGPSLCPPTLEN